MNNLISQPASQALVATIQLMADEQHEQDSIMTTSQAWNTLELLGVHEQALQLITSINGYSLETLEGVLYAHTGYRSFDQVEEGYDY